jgi:hypothetical protein
MAEPDDWSHTLTGEAAMSFLAVFFTAFFVLVLLSSIWGAEDRPHMKRPEDRSIRMPVGSWFFDRSR